MNPCEGSSALPDLDALLSAIADAVEALSAWNFPALDSALARQHILCTRIAATPAAHHGPQTASSAREVQKLNRVYHSLLQHSVQWTHTLAAIHSTAQDPFSVPSSVTFRG